MKRIEVSDKLVKEINRIFHDEEAKLYDKRHPEIEKERENWNYVLSKYLPNTYKNLIVLNIGTGTGFVPSIVNNYLEGGLIICTDISKQMLQTAKMKSYNSKNRFEFVVCDAVNLPFKKKIV
jgi:ubiquinone/menaquinone biosynthesis C-methylase UbiE